MKHRIESIFNAIKIQIPEGDHAVTALEGSRVVRGGSAKGGVDVDLVEVAHGPFVLLQMTFGPEADRTGVAAERSLKVVDVDM